MDWVVEVDVELVLIEVDVEILVLEEVLLVEVD